MTEHLHLPDSFTLIVPDDIDMTNSEDVLSWVADEITNDTGYCHEGFHLDDDETNYAERTVFVTNIQWDKSD